MKIKTNEECHLDISDNQQEYQYQSFLSNTNSRSANIWFNNDDNTNEYDRDDNANGGAKSRVATKYSSSTLQLRGGSKSPRAKMRIEEETKKVSDKNDTMIVEVDK